MAASPFVLRSRSNRWTLERIARLAQREVTQLRTNAATLGEAEIVARCDKVLLLERPSLLAEKARRRLTAKHPRLVTRRTAFETRGVTLPARSSWGGMRASDGTVVLSIWRDDIRSENGVCSYLLWAPNENGSRPWSDTPAGSERLEHCRQACERGFAEVLLVYGERLDGHLPEDRASVSGVDPAIVVQVEVVLRGREYWAVWGGRRTGVAASL
jgi:hypothetical protein